jgi:hypothetical protein
MLLTAFGWQGNSRARQPVAGRCKRRSLRGVQPLNIRATMPGTAFTGKVLCANRCVFARKDRELVCASLAALKNEAEK